MVGEGILEGNDECKEMQLPPYLPSRVFVDTIGNQKLQLFYSSPNLITPPNPALETTTTTVAYEHISIFNFWNCGAYEEPLKYPSKNSKTKIEKEETQGS